jgi:hypothetical protein
MSDEPLMEVVSRFEFRPSRPQTGSDARKWSVSTKPAAPEHAASILRDSFEDRKAAVIARNLATKKKWSFSTRLEKGSPAVSELETVSSGVVPDEIFLNSLRDTASPTTSRRRATSPDSVKSSSRPTTPKRAVPTVRSSHVEGVSEREAQLSTKPKSRREVSRGRPKTETGRPPGQAQPTGIKRPRISTERGQKQSRPVSGATPESGEKREAPHLGRSRRGQATAPAPLQDPAEAAKEQLASQELTSKAGLVSATVAKTLTPSALERLAKLRAVMNKSEF